MNWPWPGQSRVEAGAVARTKPFQMARAAGFGGYTGSMESLTIAFGIGLLMAVVAVAGLLIVKSRAAVGAATRAAELAMAGTELEAARGEVARLKAALEASATRLGAAEKDVVMLTERLTAAEAARRGDAAETDRRVRAAEQAAQDLAKAQIDAERDKLAAAQQMVAQLDARMRDAFGTLSAQALQANNAQFLTLAQQKLGGTLAEGAAAVKQQREAVETLVKPMGDTLKETRDKLTTLEALTTSMGAHNADLKTQTEQLVRALREPKVRGRYGEVQLRRVAEIAGMRAYCDFSEQDTTRDSEGNALRPDMVVRLPNNREIVVDAKANLQPYLEAIEAHAEPAHQEECMRRFADGIATQARALGSKRYWAQYEGSPEFVIMFVPGDQFVDAALALRPDLLETAANSRVILASPSTLIAVLQAVAVTFREHAISQNVQQLFELVKEFHERAAKALSFIEAMGGSMRGLLRDYNGFVGSYEGRLEPTLRKIEGLGASSGKPLPEIKVVENELRTLRGPTEAATTE